MEEENLNQNNEDEMVDVEVTEISLDEEEINELIEKLQGLKSTKTEITFDIDEDNEFLIKYEEVEGEEENESNSN